MRVTQATFTSSGTWLCPAGVTSIIALGQGGGAAGQTSSFGPGGYGGKSTFLVPVFMTVIPDTTYTVTIGAGGQASLGGDGGDTTFNSRTWKGASGNVEVRGYSVAPCADPVDPGPFNNPVSARGANNGTDTTAPLGNEIVLGSYAAKGANGGVGPNDGGGGAGGNSSDAGVGGAGGVGGTNGGAEPTNGQNAPGTSYGAGGGGGGGPSATNISAGTGGNGAGGRLIIMWAE